MILVQNGSFRCTNATGTITFEGEGGGTQKEMQSMRAGVWFYGLATVVTGILNIVWGGFEGSHQPIKAFGQHVPGQQVLAYMAGAWLVAAGTAILWRRSARVGAAGSAAIYLIFAMFWLPRFYVVPHALGFHIGILIFIVSGLAQQVLLAAPGVMVYAETETNLVRRERLGVAARWMLGLPPIFFGLGHLISVAVIVRFVPHWVPFASFWTVLTGIAFVLAGSAIVSGIRDVLAARLLTLMLFLFEFMVEIPPVFAQPHNQIAWGGAVYNLTAMGACWIFLESAASRRQEDQKQTSVAGNVATVHPDSVIV
jgi:uncharacterized membrane protein YphA (DoxX/SURF4 family)